MACPWISPVVRVPLHRRAIRVTLCESRGQWKAEISQTLSSSSWYTPSPARTTVSEAAGPLCHRRRGNNWAYPIILKQHSQTCLSEWRKIRKTCVFPPKAGWMFIDLQKLCTDISQFKCHSCWLMRGRWIPGDHRVPSRGTTRTRTVWLLHTEKRLILYVAFPSLSLLH